MSQKKKFYINIPKMIQRETIDHLMFGYVIGMQKALPASKLKKSIELFMSDFNISEDEYPVETALNMYYRMLKDYKEFRVEI